MALLGTACATAGTTRHGIPSGTEVDPQLRRDTVIPWKPDALYEAAVRLATPGRTTFDPDRAADLLSAFLQRFPTDSRRREAGDRLALVNEVRALRAELRALKAIDLGRLPR